MITPGDHRKDCCKESSNLYNYVDEDIGDRPDLSILKCKVCGCRHFEFIVDPFKFEFVGKEI